MSVDLSLGRLYHGGSMLHHLDARSKLLAILSFAIIVASFPKYSVVPLVVLLLYPVALALLGNVAWGWLLRRISLALPFILIVALFNPFFDAKPVSVMDTWMVRGGWLSFVSILLRGILALGALAVLSATTPLPSLARAMMQLRVPREMVVQLTLLYRYLFVLADEVARLLRARALRSAGTLMTFRQASSMLGVLFIRSFDRAQRVHRAMLARGFDGETRLLEESRWTHHDTVFLAVTLAIVLGTRFWLA